MKYNFVYDTEILDKMRCELSEEETKIVLATVIGQHNAIFYGYKPERLIKAIKNICERPFYEAVTKYQREDFLNIVMHDENAVVVVNDLEQYSSGFKDDLQFNSNNGTRSIQLIVTTTMPPYLVCEENLLDNFDIVFECKEDERRLRKYSELERVVHRTNNYRSTLHSGKYTTGKFTEIESYWIFVDAMKRYLDMSKTEPVVSMKSAKVARTLSDMHKESMVTIQRIEEAERLYNDRRRAS